MSEVQPRQTFKKFDWYEWKQKNLDSKLKWTSSVYICILPNHSNLNSYWESIADSNKILSTSQPNIKFKRMLRPSPIYSNPLLIRFWEIFLSLWLFRSPSIGQKGYICWHLQQNQYKHDTHESNNKKPWLSPYLYLSSPLAAWSFLIV